MDHRVVDPLTREFTFPILGLTPFLDTKFFILFGANIKNNNILTKREHSESANLCQWQNLKQK